MKTITKFWGNGCINCKALAPIFEEVKKEYADIEFHEINTSEKAEMADKYNITTLPTLLFEKDGVEIARMTGLRPKVLITKKIAEVF